MATPEQRAKNIVDRILRLEEYKTAPVLFEPYLWAQKEIEQAIADETERLRAILRSYKATTQPSVVTEERDRYREALETLNNFAVSFLIQDKDSIWARYVIRMSQQALKET